MITAIITARKDSKGVPGKNTRLVGGKPLIEYSFDIAEKAGVFDRILLSTDSDDAIKLTRKYPAVEVPFIRPPHLCGDSSSQYDVVLHALDYLESTGDPAAHFVLLQPTCPFRTIDDIREGVRMLQSGVSSVIGVVPVMHHPADYLIRNEEGKLDYLMPQFLSMRRQEFPQVFFNNGGFYGCSVNFFRTRKVFYDENSSMLEMDEMSLIDIDTEFDLRLANALLKQ